MNKLSLTWTAKYAPKKRADIVGNENSVNAIIAYLNRFRNPRLRKPGDKKAILMFGPPGIGKTSSVLAIAKSLGLDVLIINASDNRNKKSLQEIKQASRYRSVLETTSSKDIYGQIMLIDEVDGLSGQADRGGLGEIVKIIKNTRTPIILTANTISDQKFSTLKKVCEVHEFKPPTQQDVIVILKRIAAAENIDIDDEVLAELAKKSNYDIRGAINSFQTIVAGKKHITIADLEELSNRDLQIETRQFLKTIFVDADSERASQEVRGLDSVNYRKLLLLLHDFAYRFHSPGDYEQLALITEVIAKADVQLTRAEQHQHWSQLSYFYTLLTEILPKTITPAKRLPPIQDWQLNVPSYWITQARQKKGIKIAKKVAKKCKCSIKVAISDIFPYLSLIFKNDIETAAYLAIWFELFDTEPGKRKIKIIWTNEIEFFVKEHKAALRRPTNDSKRQLAAIKKRVRELYSEISFVERKEYKKRKSPVEKTTKEKVIKTKTTVTSQKTDTKTTVKKSKDTKTTVKKSKTTTEKTKTTETTKKQKEKKTKKKTTKSTVKKTTNKKSLDSFLKNKKSKQNKNNQKNKGLDNFFKAK